MTTQVLRWNFKKNKFEFYFSSIKNIFRSNPTSEYYKSGWKNVHDSASSFYTIKKFPKTIW
jgi:hypothetical protein